MSESLSHNLLCPAYAEFIPTVAHYSELLDYAHTTTGMNYHGLRKAMGLATYAQWAHFLNIS